MNTTTERKFDSLLLDMDGTLWDAVDSYCAIWNAAIDECCPQVSHVTRAQLQALMGTPIENIYEVIVGKACDYDEFMKVLSRKEHELMPALGGRLYDGVYDTLKELSKTVRLFLVSNCTAFGVPNFMRTTGLAPFFTDGISYGDTASRRTATTESSSTATASRHRSMWAIRKATAARLMPQACLLHGLRTASAAM